MDRMLTVKEVAGILGYRDQDTVRVVMRNEMIHMENPLRVPERALEEYIALNMYRPRKTVKKTQGTAGETVRIPRRRGGKLQAG